MFALKKVWWRHHLFPPENREGFGCPCTMGQCSKRTMDVDDKNIQKWQKRSESRIEDKWCRKAFLTGKAEISNMWEALGIHPLSHCEKSYRRTDGRPACVGRRSTNCTLPESREPQSAEPGPMSEKNQQSVHHRGGRGTRPTHDYIILYYIILYMFI